MPCCFRKYDSFIVCDCVLINDIGDSFALVFNTPFSSKATVELYSASEPSITSILEDLLKILTNRGISFAQITLFNPSDKTLNWFEEKGMKTFMFVDMGKEL